MFEFLTTLYFLAVPLGSTKNPLVCLVGNLPGNGANKGMGVKGVSKFFSLLRLFTGEAKELRNEIQMFVEAERADTNASQMSLERCIYLDSVIKSIPAEGLPAICELSVSCNLYDPLGLHSSYFTPKQDTYYVICSTSSNIAHCSVKKAEPSVGGVSRPKHTTLLKKILPPALTSHTGISEADRFDMEYEGLVILQSKCIYFGYIYAHHRGMHAKDVHINVSYAHQPAKALIVFVAGRENTAV